MSVFEFVFEGGSRLAVFRLAWGGESVGNHGVESGRSVSLAQADSLRVSRPLNTITLTSLEHELEHAHAHAHARSPLAQSPRPEA